MPTNRSTSRFSTSRRTTSNWNSGRRTTGTWSNRTTGSTRSTGTTGSTTWTPTNTYNPAKFSSTRQEITAKIGSFRAINQQVTGAGRVTAFSPTTASKWINYVNDGCNVYTFNNNDFCRYFGRQLQGCSPTQAFRTLKNKFGTGIKAVTRGKGNNWLIAATDRVTAKPFSSYNWK